MAELYAGGWSSPAFIAEGKFLLLKKDLPDRSAARPSGRRIPLLLAAWLAFIFGTSCTVVRPEELFRFVSSFTGAGRESMQRFAIFWGISWFTIVKGWHFTEFAILTALAASALSWLYGQTTPRSIIFAMLACIAFAASDEWHQTFVPDRFGTVQDVLIDSLGVCSAGAIMLTRLKRRSAASKAMDSSPPVERL